MSLNADREYRQREKYASVLHERVVLREEQRYELSSKSAVTNRLKSHGIELIELSKNSRIIEK
jgi:predicted TPR repeat methyltransferase